MRWWHSLRQFFLPGVLAALCLYMFLSAGHWKTSSVIRGDAHGYCAYLAAWMIYEDFDFDFYEELPQEVQWRYWLHRYEDTGYFPKLTMGVAFAQAPAFLIAHILAEPLGYAADGWSLPYQLALGLNGVLFLFIGCYFLYRWLLLRFSALVARLTVLMTVIGTNLLYYASIENTLSHLYSFSLFAAALFIFERWLRRPQAWLLIIIAFLFGWITLIRPTNALFAVVPAVVLLFNPRALRSLRWYYLIPATLAFLLPIAPQLILWKSVTGHWIYYSYGQEAIYWLRPHILEGLFSYRNGWLLYTPLMVLAITGMFFTFSISRVLSVVVPLVFVAHVYVVFSWWCWYYGNSLSIRPMIDLYPLLAFPMAATFRRLLAGHWLWWPATALLCAVLVFNNFLQSQQYHKGMLSGSAMTREAFWTLFMNTDPPGHLGLTGAYRNPDNERLLRGLPERTHRDTIVEKELAHLDFNDSTGVSYVPGYSGKAVRVSGNFGFSPVARVRASEVETPFDRTLNFSVMVRSGDYGKAMAFFVISFRAGDATYGYHAAELSKMDLTAGEWHRIDFYVREPVELPDSGMVEAYLWTQGDGVVEVDELRIRQLDCPYSEPL